MKLPSPKGNGSYTPTPEGQHLSVCTRIIDLGTQTTETQYGVKSNRKILIGWEIPSKRISFERDGEQIEGPVLHHERMTFSTHEKATFRHRLESWRGKSFSDSDFGDGPDAFDIRKLLGVGALIQIQHAKNGDRIYANMTAIMLPPGGKEAWPKREGEEIYFCLQPDLFDQSTYDNLSDGLRETISKSPEFKKLGVEAPIDNDPARQAPPSDLDDEVPW